MSALLPYKQSSIGRLPNEILRILFSIVAEDSRPHHERPRVQKCWIRLGHVCTLWRAILMDMTGLWARDVLAFGTGHVHEEILARARDAPLDVSWDFPKEADDVVHIVHLITRARKLSCFLRLAGPGQAVVRILATLPLPLLETIKISAVYTQNGPRTINPNASLARLPRLRHLNMQRFYLRPPLNGTLVTLVLGLNPHRRDVLIPGPSVDDFLQILFHNPALEKLRLDHTFHGRNTTFTEPRLVLPALQILELSYATITSAPDLVNVLSLPALAVFFIHGLGYGDPPTIEASLDNLSVALSLCQRVLGALSLFKLKLTVPDAGSSPNYAFKLYRDEPLEPQGFLVHVPFNSTTVTPHAAFLGVIKAFSNAQIAGNVWELQASKHTGESGDLHFWETLFSTFTDVERLFISEPFDGTASKLDFLRHVPPEGNVYLPRLRAAFIACKPEPDIIYALANQLGQIVRKRTELGGSTYETWIVVDPYVKAETDEDVEGDAAAGVSGENAKAAEAEVPKSVDEQLEILGKALGGGLDDWVVAGKTEWMIEV